MVYCLLENSEAFVLSYHIFVLMSSRMIDGVKALLSVENVSILFSHFCLTRLQALHSADLRRPLW